MLLVKRAVQRNTKLERQVNKDHEAKAREFCLGDPAFVPKFNGHGRSWVPGAVTQRRVYVLYELIAHGEKENHHINHILRRDPNICD
ncbi:hypothetical protein EG68_03020 [Paragonimus skrjabini miyazakii]|uniref:Uncharacterized protein n=1 Tax=Paragonimus skrjabini miyazakii TaxID=59628 RepID=A0A8S9Z299_9TREM|nr:hypothetical protein EG68_03020 [Paragonimus skrjabini miyazakii]